MTPHADESDLARLLPDHEGPHVAEAQWTCSHWGTGTPFGATQARVHSLGSSPVIVAAPYLQGKSTCLSLIQGALLPWGAQQCVCIRCTLKGPQCCIPSALSQGLSLWLKAPARTSLYDILRLSRARKAAVNAKKRLIIYIDFAVPESQDVALWLCSQLADLSKPENNRLRELGIQMFIASHYEVAFATREPGEPYRCGYGLPEVNNRPAGALRALYASEGIDLRDYSLRNVSQAILSSFVRGAPRPDHTGFADDVASTLLALTGGDKYFTNLFLEYAGQLCKTTGPEALGELPQAFRFLGDMLMADPHVERRVLPSLVKAYGDLEDVRMAIDYLLDAKEAWTTMPLQYRRALATLPILGFKVTGTHTILDFRNPIVRETAHRLQLRWRKRGTSRRRRSSADATHEITGAGQVPVAPDQLSVSPVQSEETIGEYIGTIDELAEDGANVSLRCVDTGDVLYGNCSRELLAANGITDATFFKCEVIQCGNTFRIAMRAWNPEPLDIHEWETIQKENRDLLGDGNE